ncbi:hypothetical protein RJ639_001186, partial [Escallonia herrerae]
MMNGIVALHLLPMRKDATEENGTLFRSVGCVGSGIRSELFTFNFKNMGTKCYPSLYFAIGDTRGIFLWRFFLLMTSISMILCSQMKQQASVHITNKNEM